MVCSAFLRIQPVPSIGADFTTEETEGTEFGMRKEKGQTHHSRNAIRDQIFSRVFSVPSVSSVLKRSRFSRALRAPHPSAIMFNRSERIFGEIRIQKKRRRHEFP